MDDNFKPEPISSPETIDQSVKSAELSWYQPLVSPITANMRDLLLPTLENYKLSTTHLNSFIDVKRGGPSTFLTQNLLRFPQAKSPSASFGTAIHDTLQQAHAHLLATGKKQAIEDIVSNFESILKEQYLDKHNFEVFLQHGGNILRSFLDKKYDLFTATGQPELDFANQHSIVGEAHLTGKLDFVEIDKANKMVVVTDYKTGKPAHNWAGTDDSEKIKLHKYKQQLLFYKLLVENSRDYSKYRVEKGIMQFVEPDKNDNILQLDTDFSADDLDRFAKLIGAVWDHIINLNLPDITGYDQSFKGILAFEQDLIDNII